MSKKYLLSEKQFSKLQQILMEAPLSGGGTEMSKDEVISLQTALKKTEFGNLLGNSGINKDGVDGIFGPLTKDALQKIQDKNKITDEQGRVGEKTQAILNKITPVGGFAKGPVTSAQKPKANTKIYLLFDGKTLSFILNGRIVAQWKAFSGRTKWNAKSAYQRKLVASLDKIEFMKVKEQGPIPQGAYTISSIQKRTAGGDAIQYCGGKNWVELGTEYYDSFKKLGDVHNFNSGTIQDLMAWGNYRMPITAKAGTNTYGRGSFYVHGGCIAGSIGCIDLLENMDDFVKVYEGYKSQLGFDKLDLIVDYSGSANPKFAGPTAVAQQNVGATADAKVSDMKTLPFSNTKYT